MAGTDEPGRPPSSGAGRPSDDSDEQETLIQSTRRSPPVSKLDRGQRVGRYLIEDELGRGGMGVVWLAKDELLERRVALKTIRGQVAASPRSLRLFENEARVLASLNHPNLATVFDLLVHESEPVLVMELLDGESLAQRLERGPLSVEEALRVGVQVSAGLSRAHGQGLVHRDLKPANVQLLASGDAKVLDFGLAREWMTGEEAGAELAGTPAYMSPEQWACQALDGRSDLYSLGLLLLECLTARPSLMRDDTELRHPTGERRVVDWSGLPAKLPARLHRVLRACLEDDRDARPASALEVHDTLLRDLRDVESGETISQGAAPVVLPPERDLFVGREDELAALAGVLTPEKRLVTVLGPGGSGKTRLVVHHARETLEMHPGGTWFVDLSDVHELDDLLAAVASTLDVPLGQGDPVERLARVLEARGAVRVVLDNFEQVVEHAAATVGRWLELATEARFVVTSRVVLGLPSEQVLDVEPLPLDGAALELFETRARAKKHDFAITDENREAVHELVRLVDGLPLAIELAAARTRMLSPAALVERMSDRFTVLAGAAGAPGRQATMRATIEWSWNLLVPWEQAALAQLAVFVGPFTLSAAEAVLDLSAWEDAPWSLDAVQVLLDKSLLRPIAADRSGPAAGREEQFGTYVSIHEFASEKLRTPGAIADDASGPGAARAAEQRHGRFFAGHGTNAALGALDRHGGVARRWALARVLGDVVVACRRAVARNDDAIARSTLRAFWAVMVDEGPFSAAIDLGREVLAMPSLPRAERGRVQCLVGKALDGAGQHHEGLEHVEAALALHRELEDERGIAVTLHQLGTMEAKLGRIDSARECYEESLRLSRALDEKPTAALVLFRLGALHFEQGRLEEAHHCIDQVLASSRELGHRRLEGVALSTRAQLLSDEHRSDEAEELLLRSLTIAREVRNRHGVGVALANLGLLYKGLERWDEAIVHYEQSLLVQQEMGNQRLVGVMLGNIGNLEIARGRLDEATTRLEQALAIHRQTGDRRMEAIFLGNLGYIISMRGRPREALDTLLEALAVHREVGNRRAEYPVLAKVAELHAELGEDEKAAEARAAWNDLDSEMGGQSQVPSY
ncbi:MAG: tetratricopeptide repeat protein [Acidobacteriota bacterium]